MKCSACRTELIRGSILKLETLNEHVSCSEVSPKQSWKCPNLDCPAPGVIWNDDGESYESFGHNFPFIDGNPGAFGSIDRRLYVECYKHDQDRLLFTIKGWKCYLRWTYKADEDGNVLSRHWHLEWVRPDNVVYMSGWRMFKFTIRNVWRDWRNLRKNNRSYSRKRLEDEIDRGNWPRAEWWRKFGAFMAKYALKFSPPENG